MAPAAPTPARSSPLNIWSFLLLVFREPKTAREAMRFTVATGVFVITLTALGVLAFVLRPTETQAIIGTLTAVVDPRSH